MDIKTKTKIKTVLIVSFWGYPFGGGEEYLYQTAIWQHKHNIKTYWLCFSNSKNKPYEKLSIIINDNFNFITIQIPNGFDKKTLYNWTKLINPDLVHHQGHLRKDFYDVISMLRIPFLTGIHFWSGIIDLNNEYNNINIYENAVKHYTNDDFIELNEEKNCIFYSVSNFVSECVEKITNIKIDNMCYSGSTKIKCLVENNIPINNKYVTIINIHKMKGGELLLYLLKELDIPFLMVQTEHLSEELDAKIKNMVTDKDIYLHRTNNIKNIFSKTKIFLAPSLVDETFCRTVNEAMMNSIPVITTGQGNIKYLVENAGIIINIDDKKEWKKQILKLYNDDNYYNEISDKIKEKYKEYSEEVCEKMFIDTLHKAIIKSKTNNIMLLTPWCDQGLGIQSRNYYNILKNEGYNVFIFSIRPYNADSAIELQRDPSEWLVDNIYYSPNHREKITDIEILEFITKYNIGKCLIPETCWFRIFEIAKLLRDNDVKCYAIPNIEIVRKDEITKHKYFYKILCNNKLCENIFNDHGISTTQYIGYGIDNIEYKNKKLDKILKFLFIGGMNAFSRKHILEICRGFAMAYEQNDNIHLTCTIQKTNLLEIDDSIKINEYIEHPGITFIQTHLKYSEIINLYYNTHISIQMSKHEGLGLGFYEGLATGTPIITLNTPPHNEIISDNVNGWIVDCYYKDMKDNDNSFIKSAYFDPKLLCDKILEINNLNDLDDMNSKLVDDYNDRLSGTIFKNIFIGSLN
jgi:glycosyltransferase involved in cell wall biosynthesis